MLLITPKLIVFGNFLFYFHVNVNIMCPITFICSHIETETSCLMNNNSSGYNCPQCDSRYCELPVECKQCGLTLVSAPNLARSYHHLFHIKPFIERAKLPERTYCFACAKPFDESERM